MKQLAILTIAILTLASCSPTSVRISGKIPQSAIQTIYLERFDPASSTVIDSTTTSKQGKFEFTVKKFKPQEQGYYNVVLKSGKRIPLLLCAGESVNMLIDDTLANHYQIAGSVGSTSILEISTMMDGAQSKLDSLQDAYHESIKEANTDSTQTQRIMAEYSATRIALKRNAISFLMQNANSLAAIVPLYRPLSSDEYIFSEPQDVVYFRLVADSLASKQPNSLYTRALIKDVEKLDNTALGAAAIESNINNVVGFPDIAMQDPLGKIHRLSDLKNQIILLSFTASDAPQLKILNRELLEIYNKYKDRGFEVYQVSLDRNKAKWIESITQGRLPWISVCDLRGGDSPAVGLYNVKKVPTYILIGREGTILNTNLSPSKLDNAIAAAL